MSFKIKKHSFTIVELAVIAAVIALFCGLVIAYFGSVNVYSRDSKRKTDMDAIRKAIMVQSSMGSKAYPVEGDWCCIGAVGSDRCENLESAITGYITKIPRDPSYYEGSMANCYMFRSTTSGFELYTVLEGGGMISFSQDTKVLRDADKKYSDCPNVPGEDEWISGPGFCVMKYEARRSDTMDCKDSFGNAAHCPVSKATPNIWNNISLAEAKHACSSIGAHLMNNAEWMAIADDVAKNDANWIDGKGTGSLKRGNVGSDSLKGGYAIAGSVDYGTGNDYAKLSLTNGDEIWHFSGNLSEWLSYGDSSMSFIPSAWLEYPSVDVNSFGKTSYSNIGPENKSYGSTKGVGKVRREEGGSYFLRGGSYLDTDNAGIYSLDALLASDASGTIGFRCAK